MIYGINFELIDFPTSKDAEYVEQASEDRAVEFVRESSSCLKKCFNAQLPYIFDHLKFSILKSWEAKFGVIS